MRTGGKDRTMEEMQTKGTDAFLSLKHVEKIYPNGEKAVYDFNLDIQKNEFVVIVGPSGCGKSTTLRMIAGLEDISAGDIYLENELLNYKPSNERKMAIVFQSYALYPQMTVYENIAFPLTINKYPMPAVDTTLSACREIERILRDVAFEKAVGVLFNVSARPGSARSKGESVATVFDISAEAGSLFVKLYEPYKAETLESLDARTGEIRAAWQTELETIAAAQRAKLAKENVTVNEDGYILDADGAEKIVQRKYTPYEIKVRVYETAEKLDLTPYLDKLPKELSGGQMQRVALGRAIIKNVPIFMMDEPLSNLDAKLRLTMRSEIVKLHNRIHATTVYVTHDQTEAMTMANRIVVMSKGFIQQVGSPEEIYSNPCNIFVARFIGSPSMNVFDMQFDREKKQLVCGELAMPLDDAFLAAHDAFYARKAEAFRALDENFDGKAHEAIRKILSATGEYADEKRNKHEKHGLIKQLIRKLRKEPPAEEYVFEKQVCREKLEKLTAATTADHSLLVGIRPERIRMEKRDPKKKYDGWLLVKPTVCELLGGSYNVHFDLCNRNTIGQMDAKERVTPDDEIAVHFSADDLYIFDPITGDVIR